MSIILPFSDYYPASSENPWFYCWILASVVSSCYAYTWDIKMDWGLFDSKSENKFLREEIVYSSTVRYSLSIYIPFRLLMYLKFVFREMKLFCFLFAFVNHPSMSSFNIRNQASQTSEI